MGDRGNVAIIHENNNQVWLYSHWGGSDLPELLKGALAAAKNRWSDYSYATKIILGRLLTADDWKAETGHGISCTIQDNEHPINVVDLPKLRVFTMDQGELDDSGRVPEKFKPDSRKCWSFEEYVKGVAVAD